MLSGFYLSKEDLNAVISLMLEERSAESGEAENIRNSHCKTVFIEYYMTYFVLGSWV